MGSRGNGSGKSGSGGGVTSNSAYSQAEQELRQSESLRETRTALNNFVDNLSPGDTFTVAGTYDSQNIKGAGEIITTSVKTFRVTQNKSLINTGTNKEYTVSELARAKERGSIVFNAIEPGQLNAQQFANKKYGNKGSTK